MSEAEQFNRAEGYRETLREIEKALGLSKPEGYEFGFKSKNIQTTPYMRPAADAEEPNHVERMEAAINAGLKATS